MTAKMHNFAGQWQPSPPLERHGYDRSKLENVASIIGEGVDLGLFTDEQYNIIRMGTERIAQLMEELDQRTDTWGMIHADLNKTNLIVHQGAISPIDFCLCGYGYFYMDLGGISADFGPLEIRESFLSGYRSERPLPEDHLKYIEAFFIMTILLFMATHLRNPKLQEWFGRRMQPICQDYILPLIRNERFYWNI